MSEDDRWPLARIDAVPPNLREREAVEGSHGPEVADADLLEALPELAGGATGERERHGPTGIRGAVRDASSDSVREDAGLAGPRAREDAQRPGRVFDRVPLLGVESLEVQPGSHGRHATGWV